MNSLDATFAGNSPLTKFSVSENDFIFLKEELRLTTHSYKIRGVTSFFRLSRNLPSSIEVLSAGNLALAAAHECRTLGIVCKAIVPVGISEMKMENLLQLGATIEERAFDDIWSLVLRSDMRERDDFLHPLNPKLAIGYGDISHEIQEQLPNCDALVIPYGLGGLALGMIRKLKSLRSPIPVFICEIEGHDPLNGAFKSGKSIRGPRLHSFIEAMGAPEVVPDIFAEISVHVKGVLTVSEDEVREGIRTLFISQAIRAEGAAGAVFAAALKLKERGKKNPVAVLTGGNISDDVFKKIIHG